MKTTSTRMAVMVIAIIVTILTNCIGYSQILTRRHTVFEIYQSGIPFEGGIWVSASSEKVYFSSPAMGQGDLYCFEFEADAVDRVAGTDECDIKPVVSFDGVRLAYCREHLNRSEVMLVDLDSGESRSLDSEFPFNYPIAFSQDGQHLLVGQWGPTGESRDILVDLESDREVPFRSTSYIDFASTDPEAIVGVTTHPDGAKWIGEWDFDGNLLRWVTRGDGVEPVAGSSELLVKRGIQWFLLTDNGELQLPIEGDYMDIAKLGEVVVFWYGTTWNGTPHQYGTFNVETEELTIKDSPNVRVCGMSASDRVIFFHLYDWDRREGVLHQFDIERCELIPMVAVESAQVIVEE